MTSVSVEDSKLSGRFVLERRLGSGGFGVVYQAFDRERGSVVALKTLRRAGPEALYLFKKEFRALSDIAHPNLVALYELMSEDEGWFFTMELVRGKDFLGYVYEWPEPPLAERSAWRTPETPERERSPDSDSVDKTVSLGEAELARVSDESSKAARERRVPPRLDRLRLALWQVADGLCALHRAGKLHRDIKPSNVLVTSEGQVKILDFGLVAELGALAAEVKPGEIPIAGTPSYMAPEQAKRGAVSAAADWYSVGVLLYEALTGRLPFAGHFLEVLALKQTMEPPPPSKLFPDVPQDLDSLCRDLLRRDPDARPTGTEVLRRLSGAPPPSQRGEPTSLSSTTAAPLLGRGAHLASLEKAFEAAQRGSAVTVRVYGRSGMGKTALLHEFFDQVRRCHPSAVVLSGRCYQQESVPYKALDSLMDGLSEHLKGLAPEEVETLLPSDCQALARLFPVLLQVRAVAQSRRKVLEIPDSRELRRRAFAALRDLVSRLADRRPLILAIDDLQWGDLDSAALLGELLRSPDSPAFLLVASYRSEDAETSPILRTFASAAGPGGAFADVREVEVGELSVDEARELARAILLERHADSPELAEAIARESRGNPFFLQELAQSATAEGVQLLPRDGPGTSSIANLDRLIADRVGRLPPEARQLLEVVSVAGRPLERRVAKAAAQLSTQEQAALGILRARRLVRATGAPDLEEIETYHDRIRETVVRHISVEGLRDRHRSLAEALEASGGGDPERLAVHFGEAGDLERSSHYAIEGADRAARALAFDRAARLYRLALERLPDLDRPGIQSLRVKLADALGNAGRGSESARAYQEAAAGTGPAERLELQRRAAEQFLRSGHVDEGLASIRAVLDAVGMKLAKTPRRALIQLLALRARIRLRGLHFRERDASEISPVKLIRIDTCWSVAIGLGFVDTQRGAAFQSRGLLLALEAGEPYRVARALAVEAAYSSIAGGRAREHTEKLSRASMELARRLNHSHAVGLATLTAGIAAYFEGRWKDSRELLERGESILREECTGVAFEIDNAIYCTLFSLLFLGEIGELCRRLPGSLKDADERGDLYSATNLRVRVSYIAHLAAGRVEEARQELFNAIDHWSRTRFHNQHWWNLLGRAQIELYAGDGLGAWKIVEEGWPALTRSFVLRIQLISLLSNHLHARCALAAATTGQPPDPLLKIAESDARRIESQEMAWATQLASMIRAGIASIRGDASLAMELLLSAEKGCETADMQLHAAAARRRRGQLLGGEEGRALVEAADLWMIKQGIVAPERMAAMLSPGRWEA